MIRDSFLFKVFKAFSENSLRCRQLAEFLNETKIKELLKQDMSQPLSDEVMEQIFGKVFDTILAGKGSN